MAELPMDRSQTRFVATAFLARAVVAALFLVAALSKLGDLDHFAKEVRGFRVIPDVWSNAVANVVPWLEIVTSAGLVIGVARRESRTLLMAALVGFIFLKVRAEALNITCGCFGDTWLTKIFSGWAGVALNVFLLACLAVDWLIERRLRRPAAPVATAGRAAQSAIPSAPAPST